MTNIIANLSNPQTFIGSVRNASDALVSAPPSGSGLAQPIALTEQEGLEAALKTLLGTYDSADLQAARVLRNAGLPVTPRTVEELKLVIQGRTSLSETLSELRVLLSRVVDSDLPQSEAVKVARILSAIEALSIPERETTSSALMNLVRDGGLLFESKLLTLVRDGQLPGNLENDLKWLLLKLRTLIDAQEDSDTHISWSTRSLLQEVSSKVEALVKLVEGAQLQSLRTENYFYFELPFRDGKELQRVRVEVFRHSGQGGKRSRDTSATVVLHLILSRLGAVRVSLTLVRQNLTCAFKVSHDAVAQAVRLEAPALQEAFSAHGFRLADVTCSLFAPHEIPGSLLGDGKEVDVRA